MLKSLYEPMLNVRFIPGSCGIVGALLAAFILLTWLQYEAWCETAGSPDTVNIARPSVAFDLAALQSPVLFRGDASTAYRDPAAIYHDGWFYLYFSLVKVEQDRQAYWYTAWSKSRNLVDWTQPKIFTPRDESLNYSSPDDVIRYGNEWVICLQTYPRPNHEKWGNKTSRVWIMRSTDLENWGRIQMEPGGCSETRHLVFERISTISSQNDSVKKQP